MDEDNLIYPTQFLPKIQDFFLTELLMESYMSHSEILEVSRQLGYAVEERSFFCTVFTPVNLVQELVVAQGKSRYTLLHDAAQKLGQYCGECSDMDFQMILAVLGREIVLLLSVPFGEGAQLSQYVERLRYQLKKNASNAGNTGGFPYSDQRPLRSRHHFVWI